MVLIVGITAMVLVLVAVAVAIVVVVARKAPSGLPAQPAGPRWAPADAWQAAGPALEAFGMSRLDAECFTKGQLFIKLELSDGAIRGWLDRPYPGRALEQFMGAEVELRPGEAGRAPLAQFAAAAVRELFAGFPRGARLTLRAPQIPGDSSRTWLTTPFHSPDLAVAAARVLAAFDEAAAAPATGSVQLSPIARMWQEACAMLEPLGYSKLDAECWMNGSHMGVRLELGRGSIEAWMEEARPGGALEQFMGAEIELSPGHGGHAPLARFVAGAVGELLAQLPHGASLFVKAPPIPGDSAEARISLPFRAKEHPAAAARVLLALRDVARTPAHAPAQLSPVAAAWVAAAPMLAALGMSKVDAECWSRGSVFVRIETRDGTLHGWAGRPSTGTMGSFVGQRAELRAGHHPPRSELGQFLAAATGQWLAALPNGACLSVTGPEVPGAAYGATLDMPLRAPDQPAAIVRVLLALDAAAG